MKYLNSRSKVGKVVLRATLAALLTPSVYADNIFLRAGKNLVKTVASVPVCAARTVVGLTGYDIITKKQGIPLLSTVDYAAKGVVNTAEYGVGIVIPYQTRDLNEDGVVNEKVDSYGLPGKFVRAGIVTWGLDAAFDFGGSTHGDDVVETPPPGGGGGT